MPDVRVPWPVVRKGSPGEALDIERVHAADWQPRPVREFVVKVYGRCDLQCDYCYVFRMEDSTWQSKPVAMSSETLLETANRVAEHIRDHDLQKVRVVFHGGEPLLAGTEFISAAARTIRTRMPSGTEVELALQSNGTRLTDDVLRMLLDHRIKVGVSIDGGQVAHDRHRHSARGRGSYGDVSAAVDRLRQPPYRDIFAGLLCTIDLQNDPVETFEELLEFDPPRLDLLLPHGNWTNPPPGREPVSASTPYGDWLVAVFDRWYTSPRRETGVRLFEEIMSLCLGGPSRVESIGLSPVSVLVIDTDGSFEQVDALKSAYDGAAATGMKVFSHTVDEALAHPAVAARQIGLDALCDTCQQCTVRDACGGGFYPHRYRTGSGYQNPSVYCPDLLRLIEHIRPRVLRDARALLGR